MTSTTPDAVGARTLGVREPKAEEIARVAYLFRNVRLRGEGRFFVAERTQPIARFIGAVAWWVEGGVGRFQLACPPGTGQAEAVAGLVEQVVAAAKQSGCESVQYGELLPEGHALVPLLQAQGLERLRSERFFELDFDVAWDRVSQMHARLGSLFPTSWRLESIRAHPPEIILELIAPFRLLPPEEVRHYWQATTVGGFDLDCSNILFDGDRPFAVFLVRRLSKVFYIDVQVVEASNARLRSLADLCQVHYAMQQARANGPMRLVQFRSGQEEHRQTANLALRMGGRELATQHVLARRLRS